MWSDVSEKYDREGWKKVVYGWKEVKDVTERKHIENKRDKKTLHLFNLFRNEISLLVLNDIVGPISRREEKGEMDAVNGFMVRLLTEQLDIKSCEYIYEVQDLQRESSKAGCEYIWEIGWAWDGKNYWKHESFCSVLDSRRGYARTRSREMNSVMHR